MEINFNKQNKEFNIIEKKSKWRKREKSLRKINGERVIANGQWGAFFHVKRPVVASGSQAAVVYRGKDKDGQDTDWMMSWDTPWNRSRFGNNVYSEIHPAGYFNRINWNTISDAMDGVGLQHRTSWNGCVADLKIEQDTSPLFVAELSLE